MTEPRSLLRTLSGIYLGGAFAAVIALALIAGPRWATVAGAAALCFAGVWMLLFRFVRRAIVEPVREISTDATATAGGTEPEHQTTDGISEVSDLRYAVGLLEAGVERGIADSRGATAQMAATLDALDDGVIVFGPDDSITHTNELGRSMLNPLSRSLGDMTPLPARSLVAEVRERGDRSEAEFQVGRPPKTIAAICTPITDDGVLLLVLRDVSEQRRVLTARRNFIDDASHELKTPAASLRALAETVVRALDDDPDRAREFAQEMEFEADRLSRIVSDMLDLSRLETQDPILEPLDLTALVEDVVRETLEEGAFSLRLEPVRVPGDQDALALAVRNVLSNALRYGGTDVRVDVSLTNQGHEAILAIRDNGPGIPSRDQPRVFERFYRVDAARDRATGGTGLGLAIVRHVVLQHGGRVSLESVMGEGSTFSLMLPLPVDEGAGSRS